MVEELLSEWTIVQNWGFILFLFFFFINIQFLKKERLFISMLEDLFRGKERQSMSFTLVNNEFGIKFFLCLQTVVFSAITFYLVFNYFTGFHMDSSNQLFLFFGIISLFILIFFLCKFLLNTFIGSVFYQKEQVRLWNDHFFTIVSLSGLVLFIPTLFMFYIPESFLFCFYFDLIYLLFVIILIIYKIYAIFFNRKSLLLYFILYLCSQEIVPLYFLYEAFVYLLNMVQRTVLWVQV